MQKTNESSGKRKHEISLMNVIFCLLVVFIHIISYAVAAFAPKTLKYTLVMLSQRSVSFVVQGFVMLAGVKLFLTHKDSGSYGKYILSRLRSIVIPYAFAFAVYYVFYMVFYDYPVDAVFVLKRFFTGDLVCHLYFIPIIVQFDLLFPLWKKIINNCSPVVIVPFCILLSQLFGIFMPDMVGIASDSVQFIYNDRLFITYLAFYVIGCYIGKNYDRFISVLKNDFKTVCVCFLTVFAMFVAYTYIAFNNIAYVAFIDLVHYFYVLSVLIFIYALAVKIAPRLMKNGRLLKETDAASFNIYLYHMLVLFGADFIIMKFSVMSQGLSFLIRFIVVYGVTLPCCIGYNTVKRKIKGKKSGMRQ